MTTYAYQVTLSKDLFIELEQLLLLSKDKNEIESSDDEIPGFLKPFNISFYDEVLGHLEGLKEKLSNNSNQTPVISFTLASNLFYRLFGLLENKCKSHKEETGKDAFNALTGEPLHGYGALLEVMRFAQKNMAITSDSSSFYSNS